ncbi:MAG TPA: pirin-like C-terminal cupin domain-containing protein, partial [Alphaproteobacteria bacterium]|nr:pirin-like C-terminal cupin domain-containing protein [Alphaproteobacteria bacterium]
PRYVGLQAAEIPSFPCDGDRVTVNLISGSWAGHAGPIRSLTDVHMMTVSLTAGGRARFPVSPGRTVFLYLVRGKLIIGGQGASSFHLLELNDDGDEVDVEAATDAVALFGHASPLAEPVVAHGPFVMNTHEEIVQAMRDYQAGRFGGRLGG